MLRSLQPKIKFLSADTKTSQYLSDCVTMFQVQKDLSQLAGSFSLTLVPKNTFSGIPLNTIKAYSEIYQSIKPQDVISIGVKSDGGIMTGVVDNVYKSKNMRGQRTINVRGRDFGKFLVEDNTFPGNVSNETTLKEIKRQLVSAGISKNLSDAENHPLTRIGLAYTFPKKINTDGGRSYQYSFANVPLDEAIRYILQSASSLRSQIFYDGSKTKPVSEIMRLLIDIWAGDVIASTAYDRYTGTLANLIYSLIDREFYEIFVETLNEIPVFVLKPKPFDRVGDKVHDAKGNEKEIKASDKNLWDNHKTLLYGFNNIEITENELVQSNLGVSDYEAFSVFSTIARNEIMGNSLPQIYRLPALDFYAIRKYGLRLKETTSELIKLYADEETKQTEAGGYRSIMARRDRIFNWYRYNPIFESGSVVVRGRDDFKLGDKIFLKDEITKSGSTGLTAYLKGYSHQWSVGNPFLSTLNLVRGQSEGMIAAYKKDTDKYIVKANA